MGNSIARQFHREAEDGRDQSIAILLCNQNIDVNVTVDPDERSVLHKAASKGHYEVCDALLTFKGSPALNVNLADANGSTALHAAAAEGQLRIVERLCCDERVDATVQDRYGESALHDAAARQGREQVIDALLAMGGGRIDVNAPSATGTTALHKAISAGVAENVKALLKASEIDVNASDDVGDTALHEVGLSGFFTAVACCIRELAVEIYEEAYKNNKRKPQVNKYMRVYKFIENRKLESTCAMHLFVV